MKKFNFFLIFLSILLISACDIFDDQSESIKEPDSESYEPNKDTLQKNIEQNSLSEGNICKIDSLMNELNNSKQSVENLQYQIEELESKQCVWNYISIVSILLALIVLIMQFVLPKDLKKLCNKVHNEIEAIRKDLENQINQLNSKQQFPYITNGYASKKSGNNSIENRVGQIENNLNQLEKLLNRQTEEINKMKSSDNSNIKVDKKDNKSKTNETKTLKVGYSKANSGDMFFDILDSNQEGCVYQLFFKSETMCEFDLISLDKIKSRNGWQAVVETTGNCLIEEASDYRVESRGTCIKIDGDTWQLEKKLKIKLLK